MKQVRSSVGVTLSSEMSAPGPMVLLTRLSRLVYRRATEDILGMSMKQYVALCQLREQASISQQTFCEALHLDPNNCVLLLNTLEADNLLERRRDPADRRRHIVVLTRKGQQALERADHALETVEDDVLGALSGEERETLHRLLLRADAGAFKPRADAVAP